MENLKVGDVIELGLILPGVIDNGYESAKHFKVGTLRPVRDYRSGRLILTMGNNGRFVCLHGVKSKKEGLFEKEVKIVARMRVTALKLKVGDRVKIAANSEYYNSTWANPTCDGTVYSVRDRAIWPLLALPVYVKWDNDTTNAYAHKDLINLGKHE